MNLPGEILDLWIRWNIWSWKSAVGYMESYMLQKLLDAEDETTRDHLLKKLEEKFKGCSLLLLPVCTAGRRRCKFPKQSSKTSVFH